MPVVIERNGELVLRQKETVAWTFLGILVLAGAYMIVSNLPSAKNDAEGRLGGLTLILFCAPISLFFRSFELCLDPNTKKVVLRKTWLFLRRERTFDAEDLGQVRIVSSCDTDGCWTYRLVLDLATGETVQLSASSDINHDALETVKQQFDEGLQSLKAA